MKHVDTPYYFTSEDDFIFMKSGFIEYCLQALDFDRWMSGCRLGYTWGDPTTQFYDVGPVPLITYEVTWAYSGISFWSSVRRL